MSRQTQVFGVAAMIVTIAPFNAHAQSSFEEKFFTAAGDCNVVVECAIEARNVTYLPGGDETRATATLHTHIAFANMDRKCPTSGQLHFELNVDRCYNAQNTLRDMGTLIQGEVTADITPGFASYALPLTHSLSQDYTCDMRSPLTLTLDNGEQHRVYCAQKAALGINKAGVDVQSSSASTPGPVGDPAASRLRYETRLEPDAPYTLRYDSFMSTQFYSGTIYTSQVQDDDTVCQAAPLDELAACSSDQEPVCGCDGRIWSGPCEASRAGVSIRSASPNHPSCQPSLLEQRHVTTLRQKPPMFTYEDSDIEQLCEQTSNVTVSREGMLLGGVAQDGVWIRVDPRQPHHIVPWQAMLFHGARQHTRTSGVLLQSLDETPQICGDQDYQMRACSLLDPCCGRAKGTCDAKAARATWCAALGDSDCDGLLDDEETTSDAGLLDTDGDGLRDALEIELGTAPRSPDTDGDGLSDGEEWRRGLDPAMADTDGDGLDDREDPLPRLDDHDRDGVADLNDPFPGLPDGDFDGLPDGMDAAPENPDQDGDGLVDGAEQWLGTNPNDPSDPAQRAADTDGDGLSDEDEMTITFSDPNSADTDLDGLSDLMEVMWGCSPVDEDTDGDGLSDFAELHEYYTEPTNMDSDGDGLSDALEIMQSGSSPWLVDTDGDGLSDALEIMHLGTLATSRDTDGGGLDDREEWYGSGDSRDASDDTEQIIERHVEMPFGLTALFSRDPSEPVLAMTPEVLGQEDGVEALSTRLVNLPYNQMAYQFRLRVDPEAQRRGYVEIVFEPNLQNLEEMTFQLYLLPDMFNQPGAILTWGDDERRKIRLLTHGRTIFTDQRHATARALDESWGPEFMHDVTSDTLILRVDLPPEFHDEEHDLVTVVLSMYAEVIQETEREQCDNGIDDDFNNLVDCIDPACREACAPPVEICGNGMDDDFDGLRDCMDMDCAEECIDFEICDDGFDNDDDGLIDLGDPYCEGFCDDYGCGPEPLDEICGDGYDNDFNGLIDAQDPACQLENCEDGVDNDGDGYTDCLDDKCAMDFFCCNFDDSCGGELCNDGFDNDFDGLIDCDDDECRGTAACIVPGIPPRRSLRDRISEGCGCTSVTGGAPVGDSWPRELLFVALLGGLWVMKRRTC